MTKPHQPNNSNSPKKKIEKSKPSVVPKHVDLPDQEHRNERENNPTPHQQVISTNDKGNRNARIANFIAGMALVVSAVLAWYTYKVFEIASSQKDSVKKSADASMLSAQTAQNTLIETKRYNDSYLQSQANAFNEAKRYNDGSLTIQKNTFESNNKDSKARFTRDTAALGLQIKSLKQSQEQFVKQNEPYLQVYIDSMVVNKKTEILYTIVNLTPIPVKITSQRGTGTVSKTKPTNSKDAVLISGTDINYYVIKESPQGRKLTLPQEFTNDDIKIMKDGEASVYWINEISYQNLISGKIKTYTFYVKLTKLKNGRTYTDFFTNDNSQEK